MQPGPLYNQVILITGGSRGIGLAIALRAAKDGARIVIAARTDEPDPRLPGTIHTAAQEIIAAGGEALPIVCNVRNEEDVKAAIEKAVATFGGIDIVINNAGAIQLTQTADTDMKRFDLMHDINDRAVFMVVKHALPYLKKSSNPHILSLSPPLNLDPGWIGNHVAYTRSKYGMSLCTLGFANEFKADKIAANSLWPETAIDTSAVRNLLGGDETVAKSRTPEIVADAAYWIFNQPSSECTGNLFTDVEVLTKAGVTDFSKYAIDPSKELLADFFLGAAPKTPPAVLAKAKAYEKKKEAPSATESKAETKDFSSFYLHTGVDGVSQLTLNRPTRHNALDEAFWKELPQAIAQLAGEGNTRALVISGEGTNFSSGIDLSLFKNPALADTSSDEGQAKLKALILSLQGSINSLVNAPFPVISAVHGLCLGAALDLIAACDFRYASKEAKFSIEEINIGIMADLGSLQRLPAIMGEGLVREMAFTGERIDANHALEVGLVNAVFESKEELLNKALATAKVIAGKSAKAMKASKLALNFNLQEGQKQALENAATLQLAHFDPNAIAQLIAQRKSK
jgi:citronellol/citronellal dehydrogenase